MLSFSISYWDLIYVPYFADTSERGDMGVKAGPKTGWLYPITPLPPLLYGYKGLIQMLPLCHSVKKEISNFESLKGDN
jgi:hypothetical protein